MLLLLPLLLLLTFRPGTAHRYANLGTDLAGVLVATVSKQPYGEFLQRAFFRPLGMTSTGSDDLVGCRDLLSRLVQGQLVVFGALISTANWLRLDPLGPGYRGPSGNLHSTASDLHRWNFALHGGKVLSETSYRAMVTPVREDYSLGIAVRSYVGHNNPSQTELGGVVETAAGYVVVFASERNGLDNRKATSLHNAPRDVGAVLVRMLRPPARARAAIG